MGRFWSSESSARLRKLVFKSMVWTALASGWEAMVPTETDCSTFDKFTAGKGRSLMRGESLLKTA